MLSRQQAVLEYADPYFPSTAGTLPRMAQNHLNWLQQHIFNDPNYARAAAAVSKSQKYADPQLPTLDASCTPRTKTVVRLVYNDTFNAAIDLYHDHPNDKIACLNNANAGTPGGGFMMGGRAQEEDLCHCSTLYPTLNRTFYPMRDNELVYSPDILVVQTRNRIGVHRPLKTDRRFYVDVISCAAIDRPTISRPTAWVDVDGNAYNEISYANDAQRALMEHKLGSILNVAVQNKVQRLVLAAFGCGVFRNPVRIVARMMRTLLLGDGNGPATDWASHGLVEVVIAIIDPGTPKTVWNAFMEEFREGDGLHTTGGVDIPDNIQYTAFPPGYVATADAEASNAQGGA